MEEWHMHFSHLLLHNDSEHNLDNFINEGKIEELDKDFSLQELKEAIFYKINFTKLLALMVLLTKFWNGFSIFCLLYFTNYGEKRCTLQLFLLPIFKNGSYKDPNNYRGISIMSCLGTFVCAMVNQRLNAWIEKNGKLFSPSISYCSSICKTKWIEQ